MLPEYLIKWVISWSYQTSLRRNHVNWILRKSWPRDYMIKRPHRYLSSQSLLNAINIGHSSSLIEWYFLEFSKSNSFRIIIKFSGPFSHFERFLPSLTIFQKKNHGTVLVRLKKTGKTADKPFILKIIFETLRT